MSEQYRNYVIVLDDLRYRKAEHQRAVSETDQAIAAIERIIREIHAGAGSTSNSASSVTPGDYSKMTLGDAAAAFIKSAGRPQTTREIVEGLRRGGASTRSTNLFTTMYNVLSKRAEREDADIVKAGTSWSLREFISDNASR